MIHVAPEIREKAVSAVKNVAVSFVGQLDTDELLTGTPTITEVTTTDLTIASKSINTITVSINGVDNSPGQAVICSVAGGVANVLYTVKITCTTDGTPTQTLIGSFRMQVVAD